MNIENKLDALKKVKQVEAPPFLLTRIKQQIQNQQNTAAPVKWRWAFAVSTIIILALNLSILFTQKSSDKISGIEPVVNSMHLSNTNALFNE